MLASRIRRASEPVGGLADRASRSPGRPIPPWAPGPMARRANPLPLHNFIQRKCACETPRASASSCERCSAEASLHRSAIGPAHDRLEQEADRVAQQVVSSSGATAGLERSPVRIQRSAVAVSTPAGAVPETVSRALSLPGRPLDAVTRHDMESRFGEDFSNVRIHDGSAARESARDINARAYTLGTDIVFGSGMFDPASQQGRRLLAHELAHVVQQAAGDGGDRLIRRKPVLDSTISICHRELTSTNMQVASGGLRVDLLLNPVDKSVVNCEDHKFWILLKQSEDWWLDADVAACNSTTGGDRSFYFSGLAPGTYYFKIARAFDHPYCCLTGDVLAFDEPVPATSAGCTPGHNLSPMDVVHGALDIAGFVPVLGALPDAINAGLYAAEGDWVNAGMSLVAAIPAYGDAIHATTIGGKAVLKLSKREVVILGEKGVAKSLKEAEAASEAIVKAEKAGTKVASHEAGEAGKGIEKEAASAEKEAEKEAEKAGKASNKGAASTEQEAAEKLSAEELREKIEKCLALWAAYDIYDCKKCKGYDTAPERAAKIACLTAEVAGRKAYLDNGCDFVLEGSRIKGVQKALAGHETQLAQRQVMLADCLRMPMGLPR
jgi:hypothetical protein